MTTKILWESCCIVLMAALVSACSSNAAKKRLRRRLRQSVRLRSKRQRQQNSACRKAKAMMMAEKREEKRRLMDEVAVGSAFYFDYDSSSLSDDARAAIDAHVALMMADGGNVRLKATRMSAVRVSTTSPWVSVVPMLFAITWLQAAFPVTALKQSATAKKIQLLTARASLAGARTAAWRSSKAL